MEPIRLGGIKTGLLYYLAEQSINQPNNSMQSKRSISWISMFWKHGFQDQKFSQSFELNFNKCKIFFGLSFICISTCPYVDPTFCLSACLSICFLFVCLFPCWAFLWDDQNHKGNGSQRMVEPHGQSQVRAAAGSGIIVLGYSCLSLLGSRLQLPQPSVF